MLNKEDEPYSELLKILPPVLRGIINALGLERTQYFLAQFGGTSVTIPKNTSVKLGLSHDELIALRTELEIFLGNDNRLSLPKIDKIFISFRNHEIRAVRKHASLNELAVKYNLTSRHIQNICHVQDDNQPDLFSLFSKNS